MKRLSGLISDREETPGNPHRDPNVRERMEKETKQERKDMEGRRSGARKTFDTISLLE